VAVAERTPTDADSEADLTDSVADEPVEAVTSPGSVTGDRPQRG
jgi:hypothetical protein